MKGSGGWGRTLRLAGRIIAFVLQIIHGRVEKVTRLVGLETVKRDTIPRRKALTRSKWRQRRKSEGYDGRFCPSENR